MFRKFFLNNVRKNKAPVTVVFDQRRQAPGIITWFEQLFRSAAPRDAHRSWCSSTRSSDHAVRRSSSLRAPAVKRKTFDVI